jgi:hypothetical protein
MGKKRKDRTYAKDENIGNLSGVIPAGTIVYKKVRVRADTKKSVMYDDQPNVKAIAKLLVTEDGVVPLDASRTLPDRPLHSSDLRKCRVRAAKVLSIRVVGRTYGNVKKRNRTKAYSLRDSTFEYHVGREVRSKLEFDADREQTCRSGIHVYRTYREALVHF